MRLHTAPAEAHCTCELRQTLTVVPSPVFVPPNVTFVVLLKPPAGAVIVGFVSTVNVFVALDAPLTLALAWKLPSALSAIGEEQFQVPSAAVLPLQVAENEFGPVT